MLPTTKRRLSILLSFSGAGGVETGILNLLPEFLASGVAVDLLAIFKKPPPERLNPDQPGLRVIDLGVRHTHLALPALLRYLRDEPAPVLLAAKDRAIRLAALARLLSRANIHLAGQLNTHLSAALAIKSMPFRWLRTFPMRWIYPYVDQVIAVSDGVAEDTRRLTRLSSERIQVIRNPVVSRILYEQSRLPVEHPWFAAAGIPIILGAGRLTAQKDFATLIRAFGLLRARRPCRLVILGGGPERQALEQLTAELGLAADVAFTGQVANPYAYMTKAALFVLSSRWEGSGNVLTEAMALGLPVVSTDCPSGPAEMLAGGRFGLLVPVGDCARLAEAMDQALEHPVASDLLRQAVAEYSVEYSARRYLEVLGLAPGEAV